MSFKISNAILETFSQNSKKKKFLKQCLMYFRFPKKILYKCVYLRPLFFISVLNFGLHIFIVFQIHFLFISVEHLLLLQNVFFCSFFIFGDFFSCSLYFFFKVKYHFKKTRIFASRKIYSWKFCYCNPDEISIFLLLFKSIFFLYCRLYSYWKILECFLVINMHFSFCKRNGKYINMKLYDAALYVL